MKAKDLLYWIFNYDPVEFRENYYRALARIKDLEERLWLNAGANADLLLKLNEANQEAKGLAEAIKKLAVDLDQEKADLTRERMDNERLRAEKTILDKARAILNPEKKD